MKLRLYMPIVILGLVVLLSISCSTPSNANISIIMEEISQLNKEVNKYSSGMQRQELVDIEQNSNSIIQRILKDKKSIKLDSKDILANQSNFFLKISNIDSYKNFQSRFIEFGNKNFEEAAQTFLYLQYWGEGNEPKALKLHESDIDCSSAGKIEHYSIVESGNALYLLVVEKWEGPETTCINVVTYRYNDTEWGLFDTINNGVDKEVTIGELTDDIYTTGWFIDHREGENRFSISYAFVDAYEENKYDFEISSKGVEVFVLKEGKRVSSLLIELKNGEWLSVKANDIQSDNTENSVEKEILFSDYHPIVYGEILMGGYKDNKWFNASDILNLIRGGERYKLYNIEASIGEAIGGKGIPPVESEPDTEKIELMHTQENSSDILAINGEWDALLRSPIKQKNNNDTYKNIVAELLRDRGLEGVQINITQNYRIDLEGDGIEEVIICAENVSPLTVTYKKDTYSVVILRKMINGKVENIFLRDAIYLKDGEFSEGCTMLYSIKAIADVNGDGNMEILLGYDYYEGFGYDLIEIRGDKAIEVLSNGINVG